MTRNFLMCLDVTGTAYYLVRVMFSLLTKNEAWREMAAAQRPRTRREAGAR